MELVDHVERSRLTMMKMLQRKKVQLGMRILFLWNIIFIIIIFLMVIVHV